MKSRKRLPWEAAKQRKRLPWEAAKQLDHRERYEVLDWKERNGDWFQTVIAYQEFDTDY